MNEVGKSQPVAECRHEFLSLILGEFLEKHRITCISKETSMIGQNCMTISSVSDKAFHTLLGPSLSQDFIGKK